MPNTFVPTEALAWLKRKGIKPGFDYRDVWREEHANAFTVAKMLNADLLVDVKTLVEQALEQGQTFAQFRDLLKPLLVKQGWWGIRSMTDPQSGEARPVQLGSDARIETVYRTNMRTARAAGQWERIERTKRVMPYLLYQLGPSREHRVEHAGWRGLLLPVDDPFWQAHMPPNGWGCKCWVRQVSQVEAAQLQQAGTVATTAPASQTRRWVNKRTGEEETLPVGIDPGWNYNPGQARQQHYEQTLAAKTERLHQRLSEGLGDA